MPERSIEKGMSSLHESVRVDAEKARLRGTVEMETPSELSGNMVRRAGENLNGRAKDPMEVYAEVFRVVLGDLGLDRDFKVEMGESRRYNDGQPGFFLVRREADQPDFRFGESVAEEVWKNQRTASGQRVKRQQP